MTKAILWDVDGTLQRSHLGDSIGYKALVLRRALYREEPLRNS